MRHKFVAALVTLLGLSTSAVSAQAQQCFLSDGSVMQAGEYASLGQSLDAQLIDLDGDGLVPVLLWHGDELIDHSERHLQTVKIDGLMHDADCSLLFSGQHGSRKFFVNSLDVEFLD